MTMKFSIIPVTAYQQNCSLMWCEGSKRGAVVDPGGDIERIEDAIQQFGVQVEKTLLTHGHMDHCAAARVFADKLGVPLIGPEEQDRFWLDKLPEWCEMSGFPHADAFEPDQWLKDGDVVEVGEERLEVLHCPGHTPGHVIFFHRPTPVAIVGDVIFQGSIGRTDFPMGDHDTLIRSIRSKLFPLGDDVAFIPGHGPVSTLGEERKTNPFVADKRFG